MSCATFVVSIDTRNAGSFYAKSHTAWVGRFGWCNAHQLCVQSTDTKTCEIASIISSLPSFKCQWMLALLANQFILYFLILFTPHTQTTLYFSHLFRCHHFILQQQQPIFSPSIASNKQMILSNIFCHNFFQII